MQKIIKRNGKEVVFDSSKIFNAVAAANKEVDPIHQLSDFQIEAVSEMVKDKVSQISHSVSVEEIQDMVEIAIMEMRGYEVAQKYVRYRHVREMARKSNTTDEGILSLINLSNEEIKQENSNKNPIINSTQRDYIAGEVSKDLTRRILLPQEIIKAHNEGLIHFHDMDYFIQKLHNCDLINLEDMLQNGTVISETKIDTPKSFFTACNVTTQIVAQVASNQYGGQTFTLSHLAPFVDVSRKKIKKQVIDEFSSTDIAADKDQISTIVEKRLKEEIKNGVQTIQYQLVTLMTTNGQTPFVSVFMYLDEVPEGQTRDDLAMIIEEVLKQRIKGTKNEKGVWITPAFPKLLYVLDEDNVHEDSKYWYLTELAAKCTAKRMVPDYISAKIMKELKGDVYPCMGCMDGREIVTYKYKGDIYTESFSEMWERLVRNYIIELQPNKRDYFMKTPGVKIYDQKRGLVENYGIIKNCNSKWLKLTFSDKRTIICTMDHPFETKDGKIVPAKDLGSNDLIATDSYLTTFMRKNGNEIEDQEYIHITQKEMFFKEGFSYDVTTESEHFTVSGIYSHNCRSFLTVEDSQRNEDNSHKFYGRFNGGVVTINLVDVACSSYGDMDKFWQILDERLELCHRALRCRHERLLHTTSDVSPILWQHGALARLNKGETIDKLLYDGYSTLSLGYGGLYEMCMRMTGKSHTDPSSKKFALSVMQRLNDKCSEWKNAENIAYSVYGTPMESVTYRFAKCLQKRFGVIPGVTDKNYITNSYHVHVTEKIDAFTKLAFESEFQKLSPGGAISYVEVPNLQNNIPAVLSIMKFIYDHIMYAELNTKSDYCEECGYDGEIEIVEDDSGKLVWECPNCGNRDQNKMSVARRTCGYVGSQFWNQGRTQEIKDRVLHTSIEKE